MADGSGHSVYAVKESTYGVTPTDPSLILLRNTGVTLGLSKEALESEEIRGDRQTSDFRLGANQVNGDVNFELSCSTFDPLLQGVLFSGDWASNADTASGTFDATALGYSRSTGSFITDGFVVGETIEATGYIGNGYNGASIITAVDATSITSDVIGSGSHGVETGGGDEQITSAESIRSGTTRSSFTIIRHFSDLDSGKGYHIFRGCEMDSMSLTITANSKVTGSFTVFGQSLETAATLSTLGTVTYATPSTTAMLDSFTGKLYEGLTFAEIGVMTEISLTLANTVGPRFVIGQKDSIFPSVGRSSLTGTISAYFNDSTLFDKFVDETESVIVLNMPDGSGNSQTWRVPRIKYTGAQVDVSDEGPISLSLPIQALLESTEGTNMIIERVAAS